MPTQKKPADHNCTCPTHDEWLTTSIRGAREMLGYKSDKAVRELVTRGLLPAYRISDRPGSSIRIRVSDVIALLQPVVPTSVLDDARSRQPGPLHQPLPVQGGAS